MSAHPHSGAEGKMFLVIYLILSVVVGVAVFWVFKSGEAEEEARLAAMIEAQEKANKEKRKATPPESAVAKEATKPASAKETPKGDVMDAPKKEVPPVPVKEVAKEVIKEEGGLSAEAIKEIEELYPFPKVESLMEIVKNWQDVPKKAYPKLVAIHRSVEFEIKEGGKVVAKSKLPTGAMMVPVGLQGENLTLSMGGSVPVNVTVPVDETDFKEQITERYDSFVEKSRAEILAQRKAEKERRIASLKEEEKLVEWNDGLDPRFNVIKESLKKGEAGTYALIDISRWRWGGRETIEDREVETAYVLLISEAAFGVTEVELKAIVENGKVVQWIDTLTKEEL